MTMTRYGLNVWLPVMIIAVILSLALVALKWWIGLIVIGVLTLGLLSFFRDPWRRLPSDLQVGHMLSPADGVVSAVFDVDHHDAIGAPAKIIRIFLSVLNVHVNRSPCDAEVVSITPREGKYLNAQTEESAMVNESNTIVLRTRAGGTQELIAVRQVSGMLARTIVCPLKPGDVLRRGQRFGMIQFGSTTELILPRPQQVQAHVAKGDRVRGGRTIIATLLPTTTESRST